MKKIIFILNVLFISLFLIACNFNSDDEHIHTYETDWTYNDTNHWHKASCEHKVISDKGKHTFEEVIEEATCGKDGLKTNTCSVCKYEITEVISATNNHSWDKGTVTTPATEEAEGVTTYTCTICGKTKTESIDKITHEHTYETTWSSDKTYHWHKATCEHTDLVNDKAEHSFDNYVANNDATEDKDGTKTHICKECGYEETITVEDSKGHVHTYSDDWSSDDTNHWHAATCDHTDLVSNQAEHKWKENSTTAATCTKEGSTTYTCYVCGKTKTETIKALGHDWEETSKTQATEETEGVTTYTCTVCGETKTEKTEKIAHVHIYSTAWSSDDTYHWHVATCHSTYISDRAEHNWDSNSTCTVCGKVKASTETSSTTVDVYSIDAETTTESHSWYIAAISLQDYANKTVDVTFSADMKVVNTGDAGKLDWTINGVDSEGTAKYTSIAAKSFSKGTTDWTTVKGSGNSVILGDYPILYISTYNITPENFTISIKNIDVEVTVSGETTSTKLSALKTEDGVDITKTTVSESDSEESETTSEKNWMKVDSLKETFVDGGFFDRFGLACEEDELGDSDTAEGILYHANTTTPGNELKPQFVFWCYSQPNHAGTFTASNGETIDVPTDAWMKTQMAQKMDPYLKSAKDAGIQIRGHVLTWHSQTPEFFFTKDYEYKVTYDSNGNPSNLVDAKTMTARHEWYIKTVLNHVAEWEAANGYAGAETEVSSGKKHLIYTWDVVNEAVADDAADSDTGYLRGSTSGSSTAEANSGNGCTTGGGSRWYQIYGNEEFIVNAFRFANAYAPSDVTLCYNDYNEYLNYNDGKGGSYKTNGIKRLLTAVMNGSEETVNGAAVKPRIDCMAMQSHVEPSWMNVSSYEYALKQFLKLGLDVQVTEFDIATTVEDDTENWSDYFDMFLKYSKKGTEISNYNNHHITGFTIWGLNDENSWISKNGTQYPLLFTKVDGEYLAKDCFTSVINAAKNYTE